jgi:hypothetical protein
LRGVIVSPFLRLSIGMYRYGRLRTGGFGPSRMKKQPQARHHTGMEPLQACPFEHAPTHGVHRSSQSEAIRLVHHQASLMEFTSGLFVGSKTDEISISGDELILL